MQHFLNLTVTFCLTLFVIACSVNPVSGNQDFVLFSEEREIEIGRTFNAQILNQERIYPDQELQNYVQKVGESLSNISHRSNLVYRFTILDSPDVNAFALPGGYIFIYRGLLSYLSTEDELAAVLGHELGHVTARHGVTQASKAQVLDLLSYVVGSKVGSSECRYSRRGCFSCRLWKRFRTTSRLFRFKLYVQGRLFFTRNDANSYCFKRTRALF